MSSSPDSRSSLSWSQGQAIAVVLVGRGSLYTRRPAEELSNLARRLRSVCPEWLVEVALLEQGGPSLPQALDVCQQEGAGTIVVLPVFLPLEAATRNWLRFLARRWLERLPAPARVLLAGPFDNLGSLVDAAAESVSLALQSGAAVAAANDRAGAPDPDWSVIPPHAYHVLFCQGPRCTAAGAAEVGAYLRMRLKDAGLDHGPDTFWPPARAACTPATWARSWWSTQRAPGIAGWTRTPSPGSLTATF